MRTGRGIGHWTRNGTTTVDKRHTAKRQTVKKKVAGTAFLFVDNSPLAPPQMTSYAYLGYALGISRTELMWLLFLLLAKTWRRCFWGETQIDVSLINHPRKSLSGTSVTSEVIYDFAETVLLLLLLFRGGAFFYCYMLVAPLYVRMYE